MNGAASAACVCVNMRLLRRAGVMLNCGSTLAPEVEGELQFDRHQSNFNFRGVIGISFIRPDLSFPPHLLHAILPARLLL